MKCKRINKYGENHVVTHIQAALDMYEELYAEFDPDGVLAVHGEYFVDACEAVDVVEEMLEALIKLVAHVDACYCRERPSEEDCDWCVGMKALSKAMRAK